MISRACLVVMIVAATSLTAPVRASVQRCVGPDGRTIFTDRSCESFDARPASRVSDAGSPATMDEAGAVGGFAMRGCARSPEALRHGVRDALLARDVNRLANYYHWSGTGTSAATALMTRLERLVEGANGEVELLTPASARPADATALPAVASLRAPEAVASAWWRSPAPQPAPRLPRPPQSPPVPAAPAAGDDPAMGTPAEPATPAPPPVGLRVALASDGTGDRGPSAVFALRRNAGCWWIQF